MSVLARARAWYKDALAARVRKMARLNRVVTPLERKIESLSARLDMLENRIDWGGRTLPAADALALVGDIIRDDFGSLFNALGYTGVGVEVGVYYGRFSNRILRQWRGRKLISIDPYRYFPGDAYRDDVNVQQDIQDQVYASATALLARYGARSELRRKTSAEGVVDVQDGALDFVYIDAQHQYSAVMEDCALWWPKIRAGGCLCGDDYFDIDTSRLDFGVKSAVNDFAKAQSKTVHMTLCGSNWLIYKD